MHKTIFFLSFIVLHTANIFAQEKLTWNDFADVSFTDVYSAKYDEYFLKPTFGTVIKSYEGSKISIEGYFLDFTYEEEFFMVSKNPMSSCFFCGGAGPESIVEVIFKQKPNFKTDQIVKITGYLKLNTEDVDHCNYIITDATGKLIN